MSTEIMFMAKAAKVASYDMANASLLQRNAALEGIISGILKHRDEILKANEADIANAEHLSKALIERLSLENHLDKIVHDIEQVLLLKDPFEVAFEETLPNGLMLAKHRTPLGVLGVIYESRPNVTIDIAVLAIKSGNAVILRGGSETLQTNRVLLRIIQEALEGSGLPKVAVQGILNPDRALVKAFLELHEYIDLVIPRGGTSLQEFCRKNSMIPVLAGGVGICHLFVDETADLEGALKVLYNAKIQRPTVCNALDTVLVHAAIAPFFIPKIVDFLPGVTFKLDPLVKHPSCAPATPGDWDTEWLSLTLGIKVVQNLEEAIDHIRRHSGGHSDGILTSSMENANLFVKAVDSAAVYVNASTRFTDGGEFGLGAEVAISTQKLHARGPVGLQELTTYKWVVRGDYHVRSG